MRVELKEENTDTEQETCATVQRPDYPPTRRIKLMRPRYNRKYFSHFSSPLIFFFFQSPFHLSFHLSLQFIRALRVLLLAS